MKAKWKRPILVDIECKLRVIGYGKSSIVFTSDEGDGYEIHSEYTDKEGPKLESKHYKEWAEQLENAAELMRKKSKEEQTRIENKSW